jgi:hypothetical protein
LELALRSALYLRELVITHKCLIEEGCSKTPSLPSPGVPVEGEKEEN